MLALPNAMKVAVELLGEGRYAEFCRRSAALSYDRRISYGLRRDLSVAIKHPKAKIPISIREMRDSDLPALFDMQDTLHRREQVELHGRKRHYEAKIPHCYVAIDERNGAPCYFQWLMGPHQNAKIQALFPPDWFPILKADEALLENAYTPVAYRGNGIMSAAMALIAEEAGALGCRYVITFVEQDNIPSLKGCHNAGFSPYLVRTERRFLANSITRRSFSPYTGPSQTAR